MIPLARDTREAIGEFADKVEHRGLLFDKMVLPKNWGHEVERFNDANRFNVLRACTSGARLLEEDRASAQQKANSSRAREEVKAEAAYRAKVAGAMARVRVENDDLAKRQAENSRDFLRLLEKSYPGRSQTFVGQLGGRLLINMAGGVQENAGMSLDRCFGLPFIPGSAVKGVARSAALWEIRATTDRAEKKRKLLLALLAFGFIGQDLDKKGDFLWAAGGDDRLLNEAGQPFTKDDSFKGLLSFLPANPSAPPKIVAEVLTPHPRAHEAASGKGDPRPIFFPAVEAGSEFGFAIVVSWSPPEAPVEEVLDQAGRWLRTAIEEQGIGAKTGAGYGWFRIDPQAEEKRRAEMLVLEQKAAADRAKAAAEAERKAQEAARLAVLSPEQVEAEAIRKLNEQQFAEWAKKLGEKTEVQQRAFLSVLKEAGQKETRKRWKKNKPETWGSVTKVAAALGIPLE